MEEETVVCGSCQREVPKTLYCIYCGSALFKAEKELKEPGSPKKKLEEQKPEPVSEKLPEQVAPPSPPPEPQVKQEPQKKVEIDPEVAELMEELKNNYIWKVKLCGVLGEEEVSEAVFTKLFEEYVNRINQLNQVRTEKIAYYRKEFGETNAALEDVKRKLEEMRVRATIGQIPKTELTSKAPELEEKIERLTLETSGLEAQLSRLNDFLGDTPPKDIFDLEKTARRCFESLDLMLTNGKISNKLGSDIRNDLEAALNVFDGIIGDKKKREKDLRDYLSTMEARYKVGEINISDFEAKKRKINTALAKIWV